MLQSLRFHSAQDWLQQNRCTGGKDDLQNKISENLLVQEMEVGDVEMQANKQTTLGVNWIFGLAVECRLHGPVSRQEIVSVIQKMRVRVETVARAKGGQR